MFPDGVDSVRVLPLSDDVVLPVGGLTTEGGPVPLVAVEELSWGDGMVYAASTIATFLGDLCTVNPLSSSMCTLDFVTFTTVPNSSRDRVFLPPR